MSILVDEDTRVVVQGITGGEGKFHAGQMMEYGTNVVAGAVPGRGGQEVEGVPVYDTVHEAAREEDANASVIFVPPAFSTPRLANHSPPRRTTLGTDASVSVLLTVVGRP